MPPTDTSVAILTRLPNLAKLATDKLLPTSSSEKSDVRPIRRFPRTDKLLPTKATPEAEKAEPKKKVEAELVTEPKRTTLATDRALPKTASDKAEHSEPN